VEVIDAPEEADMPFVEGADDSLNPDLRHRMISEAAYYLFTQRGYADGYELDDWLQAQAQVDHVAMKRASDGAVEEADRGQRVDVSAT
jgi:hypothetical protein